MPKKNCRRTAQEKAVHARAVSLRKMNDQQLVENFDKQFSAGVDTGRIHNEIVAQETAKQIMAALQNIKGVGKATLEKMRVAIMELLNPCTGCTMEHDCYTDYTDKRHECGSYAKYLEAGGEHIE